MDTLNILGRPVYFEYGKTVKANTSHSVRQFYASANNVLSRTTSVNACVRDSSSCEIMAISGSITRPWPRAMTSPAGSGINGSVLQWFRSYL